MASTQRVVNSYGDIRLSVCLSLPWSTELQLEGWSCWG